jgi:hypothetical protein
MRRTAARIAITRRNAHAKRGHSDNNDRRAQEPAADIFDIGEPEHHSFSQVTCFLTYRILKPAGKSQSMINRKVTNICLASIFFANQFRITIRSMTLP